MRCVVDRWKIGGGGKSLGMGNGGEERLGRACC